MHKFEKLNLGADKKKKLMLDDSCESDNSEEQKRRIDIDKKIYKEVASTDQAGKGKDDKRKGKKPGMKFV